MGTEATHVVPKCLVWLPSRVCLCWPVWPMVSSFCRSAHLRLQCLPHPGLRCLVDTTLHAKMQSTTAKTTALAHALAYTQSGPRITARPIVASVNLCPPRLLPVWTHCQTAKRMTSNPAQTLNSVAGQKRTVAFTVACAPLANWQRLPLHVNPPFLQLIAWTK